MQQKYIESKPIYDFTLVPSWVKKTAIPQNCETISDEPIEYLLADFQLNAECDSSSYFNFLITRINSPSHIEDLSQLVVDLKPENERIEYHSCTVLREGYSIDMLDTENIQTYQRETQLENHIISNKVSVVQTIDDLRVGDILIQQWTIVEYAGNHPLYGVYLRHLRYLSWNHHTHHQFNRVVNNGDDELTVKLIDTELNQNSEIVLPAGKEYEVKGQAIQARHYRSELPCKYWPPCLVITNTQSWNQVATYMSGYYMSEIPVDVSSLKNMVKGSLPELVWERAGESEILALIRFVQNEIRYRSHSPGAYSHLPKPPAHVLEKRAGDCKDKSSLLVTLLKLIGVEASLCLVNSGLKDGIKIMHPSPWLFNHMIVCFSYNGSQFFVDATVKGQAGDLANLDPPDYRLALVLEAETNDLTQLNPNRKKTVLRKEHYFDLRGAKDNVRTLTVKYEYFGRRADNIRYYIDSNSAKLIGLDAAKSARENINAELELIEKFGVQSDDTQYNQITAIESYKLASPEEADERYRISSELHMDYLFPADQVLPTEIQADGCIEHRIIIQYDNIPDIDNDYFTLSNKWFEYVDSIEKNANTLVFTMRIRPLEYYVESHELNDLRKDAISVQNRSVSMFPASGEDKRAFYKDLFRDFSIWITIVLVTFGLLVYFDA